MCTRPMFVSDLFDERRIRFFSFAGYGFCSETLGPGALREIINFILDDRVGSQNGIFWNFSLNPHHLIVSRIVRGCFQIMFRLQQLQLQLWNALSDSRLAPQGRKEKYTYSCIFTTSLLLKRWKGVFTSPNGWSMFCRGSMLMCRAIEEL